MRDPRHIAHDRVGSVMVETAVMIPLVLIFLLGMIEFLFAFHQWNSAMKAVERGARIAAVSSPVDGGFSNITGLNGGALPGDPVPSGLYAIRCEATNAGGSSGTCTGTGAGAYTAAAMQRIVFGRGGGAACVTRTGPYEVGMCNMFDRITAANVSVEYSQTGLGFAGRPGGMVPTVTVSLRNLSFAFFFLDGFLGLPPIPMPAMRVTITGEDLSSAAPS